MIRKIEHLSARALPCLERIPFDSWELRFAQGHTRRANSVNVVAKGQNDVSEKIGYCEAVYAEHNQPCHFRITPLAQQDNLDAVLADHGYDAFDPTDVRILDLSKGKYENSPDVIVTDTESPQWLRGLAQLTGQIDEEAAIFARMLAQVKGLKICASIKRDDRIICCGYAVVEDGFLGLFEIATDPGFQRQGQANKKGNAFWDHLGFGAPLYSYHYRSKAI